MPKKKAEIKIPPKFSHTICNEIGHYVYRLVDPRNGETFYVGKGLNNRVFDHLGEVKRAVKKKAPDKRRVRRIKEIYDAGLEVIHIIHQHKIPCESAAKCVETALIDAYQGLTNGQGGLDGRKRGQRNSNQIIAQYSLPPLVPEHKLMLISVNQSHTIQSVRKTLYDQVRFAWKIKLDKAREADYVVAVVRGETKGVFKVKEWLPANRRNFPHITELLGRKNYPKRYGFNGRRAMPKIRDMYVGKRLPEDLQFGRGMPIRYSY